MLFTGVMLTKAGPKCLEYNARFGDPEAQTLLPLLESDLAEIMLACITGNLHQVDLTVENKFCATVILASEGYPGEYQQGHKIKIREVYSDSTRLRCTSTEELAEEYVVQSHVNYLGAGMKLDYDGELATHGGRVMAVVAKRDTLKKAVQTAYVGVNRVSFEGMHFRRDIAYRSLPDVGSENSEEHQSMC